MSAPQIETWYGNQSIALKNSQIVREFSMLTGSWTTLRVGVLYTFNTASLATLTGTPRFAVGICSGSANCYADAVCGHWVGWRTTAANYNYTSASAGRYWSTNGAAFTRRASGSADIATSNCISNWYVTAEHYTGSVLKGKHMMLVDFTRNLTQANGLSAITCSGYYVNTINNNTGQHTTGTLLRNLQENTPSDGYLTAMSSLGLRVDEALSGSFNAVNISWDRESPSNDVLIHGIGVSVLS